ncbi:MAG: hypothetical protein ACK2UN_02705, partial [Candidatus Promineifilaceae bacterium]
RQCPLNGRTSGGNILVEVTFQQNRSGNVWQTQTNISHGRLKRNDFLVGALVPCDIDNSFFRWKNFLPLDERT